MPVAPNSRNGESIFDSIGVLPRDRAGHQVVGDPRSCPAGVILVEPASAETSASVVDVKWPCRTGEMLPLIFRDDLRHTLVQMLCQGKCVMQEYAMRDGRRLTTRPGRARAKMVQKSTAIASGYITLGQGTHWWLNNGILGACRQHKMQVPPANSWSAPKCCGKDLSNADMRHD
jgi:hypothetical protein